MTNKLRTALVVLAGVGAAVAASFGLSASAAQTPANLAAAQGYFPSSGIGEPTRFLNIGSFAGVTAPGHYATGFLSTGDAWTAYGNVWGGLVDTSNPGATNTQSDSYLGYPAPQPILVTGTPLAFGPQDGANISAVASQLQTTISGGNDFVFTYLAQQMVAAGYANSIVRLGWEANGNWYPWSAPGNEALYIQAFQHAVTVIRASDPKARFDWNSNGCGTPTDFAAYPGDSYVDMIGADIYDAGGTSFAGCARPYETFAVQHGKQVAYDEWGFSTSAGDDPAFIQSAYNWMVSLPVSGPGSLLDDSFFDAGSDNGTEQIQSEPKSLAMFNSLFGQCCAPPPTTTTTTTTTVAPTTTTTTTVAPTTTTTVPGQPITNVPCVVELPTLTLGRCSGNFYPQSP